MDRNILIYKYQESNLLDVLLKHMEEEKIEYHFANKNEKSPRNITNILYFYDSKNQPTELKNVPNIPITLVSKEKYILDGKKNINYIITNLVEDKTNYTNVQKEYLVKKGIYNIFLKKLDELLENGNLYNGMIYDLTEIKSTPDNWIFKFNSINETYTWLSKKNKSLPNDFTRKVVNFYDEKVYNDSLKEINYLTEKLVEIKEGKRVLDIFICTKEELEKFKKNYFFKLLIKNISKTYQFYLIDKEKLFSKEKEEASKLLDGIAIYDDCIYKDTYQDEFSLGYVDCKKETREEYDRYFDYILKEYGNRILTESDLNEF